MLVLFINLVDVKNLYLPYIQAFLNVYSVWTNLGSVLIEALKADSLCEGNASDPAGLGAGDVAEASREQILGHLGGFPAARVPGHHNHRVKPHQLHDPISVLKDRQVLLLPAELGQFPKALFLAEV